MISRTVTIKLQSDRVDRPIALLVQAASRFESSIYIETGYKKINAKSIMGIMAFNPSEGMAINIVTEGSDEEEAVLAIEKFLVCE